MNEKASVSDKETRTNEHEGKLVVLLIDDDETIVSAFGEALAMAGYSVISALSGQEGLDLFKEDHVDLIVCDLNMPGMDGFSVAQAVHKECHVRGLCKPTFILFTAWAKEIAGDKRIAEFGVNAVLSKPAKISELVQLF